MKLKCLAKVQKALISAPLNFEYGGVTFAFTAKIKLVDDATVTALTTDKQTVKDLLVGWDDFVDEGQDVPFSKEVLDEMLGFPGIAGRLSIECVNAQYRVTEKN